MRAGDITRDEIPTLNAKDSGLLALQWMDEFKVKHLPVVDENHLLGLISDTVVLELADPEAALSTVSDKLEQLYIDESQHIYDVVRMAAEYSLTAIPLVDKELHYVGVVSIYSLIRELSRFASISEPGSVLVLEVNQNDYQLSEIAQIVEGNDSRILSANITSRPDSTKLQITLKINRNNLDAVVQTFIRYDYVISASFHEPRFDDALQSRYNELMRFLNT